MTTSTSKIVVLNPVAPPLTSKGDMATRPDNLRGKVLGCLWNNRVGGDRILEGLAQLLTEKYELSGVVHKKKRYIGEPSPSYIIEDLASSCDVAITSLGN